MLLLLDRERERERETHICFGNIPHFSFSLPFSCVSANAKNSSGRPPVFNSLIVSMLHVYDVYQLLKVVELHQNGLSLERRSSKYMCLCVSEFPSSFRASQPLITAVLVRHTVN